MDVSIVNTVINTPRLTLRQWRQDDLNDLFEYASVPGVGEAAGWKHHKTLEDSRTILELFIKQGNVFAVVHKQNNKVIGSLGLHESWANDVKDYVGLNIKEIGYVLSKNYWGQGLMPEAVSALINYCFNELELDALTVGHFVENNQSKRVIEKCGFSYVRNAEYFAKQLSQTFDDMQYILYK